MKKWSIFYLVFLLTYASNSLGQEKNLFSNTCLGIEIGTWKPNNLRTGETSYTLNFYKENLYLGFFLTTPLKSNLSIRLTIGYFSHDENTNIDYQKSIVLIPILFDIKYMLISGSKISPYVSYGVGTCISHKNKSEIFSLNFNRDKLGYGLNFGTGFDFLISKHWALGIEFRYHYLKFSNVFIFTDDYSGPKINLTLYYIFK